jgi:hypothetical protein
VQVEATRDKEGTNGDTTQANALTQRISKGLECPQATGSATMSLTGLYNDCTLGQLPARSARSPTLKARRNVLPDMPSIVELSCSMAVEMPNMAGMVLAGI